MFTIELDAGGYQLVADGVESGVTDYGDEAAVEVDGKTYTTLVESKQEALDEPPTICLVLDEVPAVEEVEFDISVDEGDGTEDEDDPEEE